MRSSEGLPGPKITVPYSVEPTYSRPVNDVPSAIGPPMPAPVSMSNCCPAKLPSGNWLNARPLLLSTSISVEPGPGSSPTNVPTPVSTSMVKSSPERLLP